MSNRFCAVDGLRYELDVIRAAIFGGSSMTLTQVEIRTVTADGTPVAVVLAARYQDDGVIVVDFEKAVDAVHVLTEALKAKGSTESKAGA